ncbi:MAG TPA: MFS transporter [Longilinea sp.]|nr:MFS transporter [Longilinea sp.]
MEAVASPAVKKIAKRKVLRIPTTRRERWSWYLYDFGNSAYAAVVLLAVYSAYFKNSVVGGAEGSRMWGLAVGIAMLVVALISPVLGAIADFSATKKKFLAFFTGMSCVFTALLFFVGPGDVFTGFLFFILAEIGYRSAQVFYDALLPEIAKPEEVGRISGIGWAIGSFGGIVCLAIVLGLIMFVGGNEIIRLSFLITAVFYSVSSIFLFLWLRERVEPQVLPVKQNYFSVAFKQLWSTIKAARSYKEYLKFLVSFLIYNDGIMMTMDFAAIIGATLFGMEQNQLIIFMIIVQVTSVIGAYAFGFLADKYGSKPTLVISIILMVFTVGSMFFIQTIPVFYMAGAMAGFALTGVQSVSRTMVSQLAPPGQSAEFFGFFSMAGRTSSFIGPAVYGFIAAEAALYFTGNGMEALPAEQAGIRVALFSIIIFLGIGLGLLFTVKPSKALEETSASE